MPLPNADAVARNLRDLLAKQVTAKPSPALAVATAAYVAVYADDAGAPQVVAAVDLPFSAHVGAALAMIPAAVALENVQRKRLEDSLRENFEEIVNILAGVVNVATGKHVKLVAVVAPSAASPEAQAIMKKPAARVDFTVDVPGYGAGKLALLSA
ncbi:MAG: hypothetical protein HYZ29_32585 [Myxococcales bacterium]|nr:hypothetical protein [Myxococcales bacterium]